MKGSYAEAYAEENNIKFVATEKTLEKGEVLSDGSCGDGVTYTLYASGLLVISGSGTMTDFRSSGSMPWYKYKDKIITVEIGAGVTSIGEYAFYDCSILTNISLPSGVTSIGDSAFYGCSNLRSIGLPSGVTSIGNSVFRGCSRLSSVDLPSGVTSIGDRAFEDCSSLSSISIPDSVTGIGRYAFCSSGLTSITIPGRVAGIETMTFASCSNLTSITILEGVTSIGGYAFQNSSNLSSISIPESVTSINSNAFFGCSPTLYVVQGSYAETYAQENYSKYETIEKTPESGETEGNEGVLSSGSCGDGVTYTLYESGLLVISGNGAMADSSSPIKIPWYGFIDKIIAVEIGTGVTSIGGYAFLGCSSLASITIPASVTSIGNYAFNGCSSLTSITIPASVTSIGNSAFSGCNSLTSITIPASVTSIEAHAFSYCSSLASITIPEGVTSIGNYAFFCCSSLTSITIPEGVTSIGESTFQSCSSLTSITIPEGVTNIEMNAFRGCSSLASIMIPASVTSIGNYAFTGCSSLASITIPASVTSIGNSAFQNCSSLVSITIPEGVASIGEYAFYDCSSLASITIPASVTSIGTDVFKDCSPDLVITGTGDSYAETYAKENNIPFIDMGEVLAGDIPSGDVDEIPEGLWIAGIDEKGYTYTGKAIKPTVRVYEGKTLLTEKVDCTLSIKNNTKANDASNAKTAPTITVTGKGNYSGKDTKTFVIQPKNLSDSAIQAEDLFKAHTGSEQKPVPVVKDKETGKALKKNTDFTVAYPDSQTGAYQEVGTYRILITGTGNYTGTKEISLTITDQKLMSQVTVKKIDNENYTGSAIQPESVVKHGGQTLTKGTDYEVTYQNNTEPGTATVILTGKGSYVGTKEVSFKILGTPITKAKVTGLPAKVTYTGAAIQAGSGEWSTKPVLTLSGKTLIEGTDYTISYKKNVEKGKAEILFTGINGYSGSLKKTFTIAAYDLGTDQDKQVKVSLPETISYEKGGSKPKPVVTFGGRTLEEGKDYTLIHKNNKAVTAGSNPAKAPLVQVKGKGNFTGILEQSFTIHPKSLQDLELTAADRVAKDKTNAHITTVKIIDVNGKALSKGTDYDADISYTYKAETVLKDGTVKKAGEAIGADILPAGTTVVATVTGKGNYTGTLSGEYRMVQYDIGKARVTIPPQIYTGKPIEPGMDKLTVTYQGKELGAESYKITGYTNNTKKGTATVTIEGIGAYGGTKTVKFTIKAKGFLWWIKPSTEQ